ncbi:unnamed protein product [Bursaphelenchus xylophilus]|uniref:(pine wood nematode) hypothetical protein n=1 Tax=Bursaphelenchus xylophilus TaxID=6326 RepID=A0A1I7SB23_BURXY|nr:unnamed protein product [Bursaphelenchus xylophilus]CAG9131701.1 unnamed protein product [Bursaphelenchus xylophilus]
MTERAVQFGVPRDFWYAPKEKCFCNLCHIRTGSVWACVITFAISVAGIIFIIFQRHQLDKLTNLSAIYEHYPLLGAFVLLIFSSILALIGSLSQKKAFYIPHLVVSFFSQIIFMYGVIWFVILLVSKNKENNAHYFDLAWLIGLIIGQVVLIYLLDVIYRDYKYLNRKFG